MDSPRSAPGQWTDPLWDVVLERHTRNVLNGILVRVAQLRLWCSSGSSGSSCRFCWHAHGSGGIGGVSSISDSLRTTGLDAARVVVPNDANEVVCLAQDEHRGLVDVRVSHGKVVDVVIVHTPNSNLSLADDSIWVGTLRLSDHDVTVFSGLVIVRLRLGGCCPTSIRLISLTACSKLLSSRQPHAAEN